MSAPGFWMNETSGVLRPAVEAYLRREPMTPGQVAAMRAYFRQWLASDLWRDVEELRAKIDELDSASAIRTWLREALELGIDPL